MNAEESSSSKNIISNSKNAHIKLHKSYPTQTLRAARGSSLVDHMSRTDLSDLWKLFEY